MEIFRFLGNTLVLQSILMLQASQAVHLIVLAWLFIPLTLVSLCSITYKKALSQDSRYIVDIYLELVGQLSSASDETHGF